MTPAVLRQFFFKQCVLPFGSIADSFCYCLPSSLSCTVEGGIHPPSSHVVSLLRRFSLLGKKQRVEACWLLCWRSILPVGMEDIQESKNKLLEVNTLCKVLGVQLDLRQSGDRLWFVPNTEERVEELVNELDEALRTKILSRSEGDKLRGRLQFASSQVFGRKFRRLPKVLSNHVTQGRKTMAKGEKTVIQELEMMAALAAVRVWRKLIKACRVVLFTDSEAVRGAFLKS